MVALLLLVSGSVFAKRTDEVILYNGNNITGEVKSLQQGKLRFKTDHAGTIFFEWDYVHYLSSSSFFEVETDAGDFFYGHLGAGADGRKLEVRGEEETVTLDMDRVVEIAPIKETFWQRMDGSVSLGGTYVSADESLQFSLGAQATYTQPKYSESVKLSSIQTRREGEEDILRDSLEFNYTRFHKNRYFGTGTLVFTRNTELGLDLRSELGYAFGRNRLITNRSTLSGRAGFSISRDHQSGEERSDIIGWAVLGANFHYFLYNYPNTDILFDLVVQPGLTEWPRTRVTLSASVRREVVRDFTLNLSVYDTYDSDPGEAATSKHDLSVTMGLGWTF